MIRVDAIWLYAEPFDMRAGTESALSRVVTCGVQLQALVDALHEELLTHAILHADDTPVAMLKPGKAKTHNAHLWSYCTTSFNAVKAVVFDFAESRAGEYARDFLGIDIDVPDIQFNVSSVLSHGIPLWSMRGASAAQDGHTIWLFAGSLRAGKRAAAIMSLVHSAKLSGHDPYAYSRDVLERLPTQPASRIQELLPHRCTHLS